MTMAELFYFPKAGLEEPKDNVAKCLGLLVLCNWVLQILAKVLGSEIVMVLNTWWLWIDLRPIAVPDELSWNISNHAILQVVVWYWSVQGHVDCNVCSLFLSCSVFWHRVTHPWYPCHAAETRREWYSLKIVQRRQQSLRSSWASVPEKVSGPSRNGWVGRKGIGL